MLRSKISEIAAYLPEQRVSNKDLIEILNKEKTILSPGILERLFGIQERRFAAKNEQVSDLAVKAAQKIIGKVDKTKIDLLIFAAACSDLIEPATSNIVQSKLGLKCPCMDLKNACNSMVTAMHTADAFIKAGMYKNILITNGEKLSDAINYTITDTEHLKRAMASFTLGDAGTALLMSASDDVSGLYHQEFMTAGDHWELCTILGGGSMFPHDISKLYFEGKTTELKEAMIVNSKDFVLQALKRSGWKIESINHIFTHQVSNQTFKVIAETVGLNKDKFINTFEKYGNTAAASIPLSLVHAQDTNILKKGNKIAIVGLAAGLSVSVQTLIW